MMPRWTKDEIATAQRLIADKASDEQCLAAVGRNFQACYVKVSRWDEQRVRVRKPREAPPVEVPAPVIEEAKRRLSAPKTITAWICGDPPFFASALGRKMGMTV